MNTPSLSKRLLSARGRVAAVVLVPFQLSPHSPRTTGARARRAARVCGVEGSVKVGQTVGTALVAMLCVALFALLPLGAGTPGSGTVGAPDPTRDVVFIARDMAFYTDGSKAVNPVIRLRAGEDVRLVFRNDDEGIRHTLAIQDWNVLLELPKGGREVSMVVRVPDRTGRHWYVCEPHRSMMVGIVEVTAE